MSLRNKTRNQKTNKVEQTVVISKRALKAKKKEVIPKVATPTQEESEGPEVDDEILNYMITQQKMTNRYKLTAIALYKHYGDFGEMGSNMLRKYCENVLQEEFEPDQIPHIKKALRDAKAKANPVKKIKKTI